MGSDTFPYRARPIPPDRNLSTNFFLGPTHPENCRISVVWKNNQIGTTMDQTKELLEMPREFVKDGRQFITRCSKPDKREFLRISQAVGMGFLIMGVIGYVVKLIHIPVNIILVGGA